VALGASTSGQTTKVASKASGATCSLGCVTTYHNDNSRDGVNGSETTLTPAAVSSSSFTLLQHFDNLDGLVYAQPLYLSGVQMSVGCPGGNKNIAIVATENNSIYVYDVTNPASIQLCYKTNTNAPGEYAIPFTDLGGNSPECNNLIPQEGITGTPAIDLAVKPPAMFFVSAVKTSSTSWDFKLNVLTLNNGKIPPGTPFYLSSLITAQSGGANFSAINENQRASLALFRPGTSNVANLYVAFASHCDSIPYSGYVAGFQFAYSSKTLKSLGVFNSESAAGASSGGIWMSDAAPPVDSKGNVYVAVGNGPWSGQPNNPAVPASLGESVVQLTQSGSKLSASDYYTPNDYSYLNNGSTVKGVLKKVCVAHNTAPSCPSSDTFTLTTNDYDLGAGALTLIQPAGSTTSLCGSSKSELIAGGKEGVMYGICYNPTPSTGKVMGGLDSCGYNFSSACFANLDNVAALTACTQASSPTPGAIAQCFYGTPNLANQSSGAATGIRGTPAFWAGPTANPQNYLYTVGVADVLRAYPYTSSGLFNTAGAQDVFPNSYAYPGATPSVSWNATTGDPTTGVVWTMDTGPYGLTTRAAGPAVLFAYNAIPNGSTLTNAFRSDKLKLPAGTNPGPGAVKFGVPTVAGGMVFVAGGAANPQYYFPSSSGTNCTPSASGGSCLGGFYIYGIAPSSTKTETPGPTASGDPAASAQK